MSELKVVETIATCVETDSREVDEKLERESCLKLNVRFVNNNGVHMYIYCNKDPESLILNRTQVIISSHSLLLLHRHGTCCSRFQRPDAGPRNTIDIVNSSFVNEHICIDHKLENLSLDRIKNGPFPFISYIALNCVHIYNGWRICNKKSQRTKIFHW